MIRLIMRLFGWYLHELVAAYNPDTYTYDE